MISYIDDKNLIARCVHSRNWDLINTVILPECIQINDMDKTYAAIVKDIPPLSTLYNKRFASISFAFKNVSREFSPDDKEFVDRLISRLLSYILEHPAYYVIKVPSHMTTLLSSIGEKPLGFFVGGTICYMNANEPDQRNSSTVTVNIVEKAELKKHAMEMIQLGIDGFSDYFGQYHISQFTRPRAGKIYENWVLEYIQEGRGITFGAFIEDKLVGFLSCDDFGSTLELVLSSVSKNARGMRVYESMIRESTVFGFKKDKILTVSTQFDNFEVQRAWINNGYKPYYSFYLFHNNSL